MDIHRQELKRTHVIRVNGRIDSSNAADLEKALMESIKEGTGNVVVNLSGVEYMSSAALRALIAALKETRGRRIGAGNLVLAEAPQHIREVFDLAALNSLFTFYDDETQAVGSF